MVASLKDKKSITVNNASQKNLSESGSEANIPERKPYKIWVERGSGFRNRSMKSWLQDNDIEMYSTHNEGKSVVPERFIGLSKSKNVYIDKLADIINEYNNTSHSTIKMKSVNVNSSTYTEFDRQNNKKDPKFKVGDHVRISKYKNIFEKGYIPNWSEECFVIKKAKTTTSY